MQITAAFIQRLKDFDVFLDLNFMSPNNSYASNPILKIMNLDFSAAKNTN